MHQRKYLPIRVNVNTETKPSSFCLSCKNCVTFVNSLLVCSREIWKILFDLSMTDLKKKSGGGARSVLCHSVHWVLCPGLAGSEIFAQTVIL